MPEDKLTFTSGNAVPDFEEVNDTQAPAWEPNSEEQSTLLRVLSRVEQDMYEEQSAYHEEWDNAGLIYEAYTEPKPNRPSFALPISHMLIEKALSEEVDAFPDIDLDTQDDDDRMKLPIMTSAKKYALAATNWESIKIDARRICRIYGVCPVRISYIRETRKIKERVVIENDEGHQIAFEEKWDYPTDDIIMEVIDDPRRFLLDPNVRDISDRRCSDCALFTEVSWEAYKQSVQHNRFYKNLEFVRPGAEYSINTEGVSTPPEELGQDNHERNVKILEYWNQKTDEYIVIANGILIRHTPLPDDHKKLPFALMHMYRRPHTVYSKGVPKLVESIEAAYNKMMNATTQATGLAFPVIATTEDAGIDPRALRAYPGIVMEGALDKMRLEQLGSVPSEVYKYAEKLELWLSWASGINFQDLVGNSSERVGIEALKKESMIGRINFNLRENEANFVEWLGDLLIQDIQQYYPAMRIRAITSSDHLPDIPEENKVTDEATGEVRGILEMRRIPVEMGVEFKEVENESEGIFELKAVKSDKSSFILARPEFIRTKTKFMIRTVRPSAMGSSKEAKKLIFQELLSTALDTNGAVVQQEANPETGAPGKPVFNIRYLAERLADAFELPVNKALADQDEKSGREASSEIEEMAKGIVDSFGNNPIEFNPEGTNPMSQFGQSGQNANVPAAQQGQLASTIS